MPTPPPFSLRGVTAGQVLPAAADPVQGTWQVVKVHQMNENMGTTLI